MLTCTCTSLHVHVHTHTHAGACTHTHTHTFTHISTTHRTPCCDIPTTSGAMRGACARRAPHSNGLHCPYTPPPPDFTPTPAPSPRPPHKPGRVPAGWRPHHPADHQGALWPDLVCAVAAPGVPHQLQVRTRSRARVCVHESVCACACTHTHWPWVYGCTLAQQEWLYKLGASGCPGACDPTVRLDRGRVPGELETSAGQARRGRALSRGEPPPTMPVV
jgi:hypothetical protein